MSFPGYPVRSRAAQVAAMLLALSAVALVSGCDSDDETAGADATTEDGASSGAGTASAERIRARIIGNTVGGTMSPDSSYTEYYAEDGTIHGPGYEAEWRIDGDRMCFDYDEAEQADCYDVRIDGDSVSWRRNGETEGRGTIVEGNPNNF